MNKKITAAAAALALTAMSFTGVTAQDTIKVFVNGNEVQFTEAAPFIENDRTLVPMRAIFEALGAAVEWDEETKTVLSYDPVSEVAITMQIDSQTMFVNGEEVTLDVPAKIVNDRTVVPIRAVSEGMNSKVDWDGETKTITITKGH